jgi:hypothetical protein
MSGCRWDPVAGFSEKGYELSHFILSEKFLDHVSSCHVIKMIYVPGSLPS